MASLTSPRLAAAGGGNGQGGNARGSSGRSSVGCFLRSTHIRTADGDRKVEDSVAGDLLPTVFGGVCPIQWIGRYPFKKSDPIKTSAKTYCRSGSRGQRSVPMFRAWICMSQRRMHCSSGSSCVGKPPHQRHDDYAPRHPRTRRIGVLRYRDRASQCDLPTRGSLGDLDERR